MRILLIIGLLLLPSPVFAQQSNRLELRWDLTYESVLSAHHVSKDEWIRTWLGSHESPAKKLISDWSDGPIESSILIEHPAFHAGEQITFWAVRTKNQAFQWLLTEGKPPDRVKEPLDPKLYDKLFARMLSWKQAKPLKRENTSAQDIPGYLGFLSLYNRDNSRQMLLTRKDFFICLTKNCDSARSGRLTKALGILRHD